MAAEAQALAEVLAVKDGERWPPMIDSLTAPPGLETALGAALGEELTSALDPEADRHWRELPPLAFAPPLPGGAQALRELVDAPAALARALSQIGLVDDEQIALNCQAELAPGQTLVSREGAVWRWDGYSIRAGAPTPTAVRLRQRNRLTALRETLAAAEQDAARATTAQQQAEQLARAAGAAEQSTRNTRREREHGLERARAALAGLRGQAATVAARLAGADEQLQRLTHEHQEAAAALEDARAAHAARPDLDGMRAAVERCRAELTRARARESTASIGTRYVGQGACDACRAASRHRVGTEWLGRARQWCGEPRFRPCPGLDLAQGEMAALEAAPARPPPVRKWRWKRFRWRTACTGAPLRH